MKSSILPCRKTFRRIIARAVTVGIVLAVAALRLHAQTWNIQWSDEFNASRRLVSAERKIGDSR